MICLYQGSFFVGVEGGGEKRAEGCFLANVDCWAKLINYRTKNLVFILEVYLNVSNTFFLNNFQVATGPEVLAATFNQTVDMQQHLIRL